MWYGEMKKETSSAPRTITLNLPDADCKRLMDAAGLAGMSAGELLEAFVNDLVCGDHSNGSDERMYAQAWFDRCGFAHLTGHRFLRHLLEYGYIDDFLTHYDILRECQEDLLAEEPTDSQEANQEEIEYQRKCLREAYDDYTRAARQFGFAAESYDEGLARVLHWRDEVNKLMLPAQETVQEASRSELGYEPEF